MTDPNPSPLAKRTNSNSSNATTSNLPPPRTSKPLTPVSAPLSNTRLSRLVYLLVLLTALLTAYYSYRITQHKSEVGGWWNLALGRRQPPAAYNQGHGTGFSKGRGQPRSDKPQGQESSVEDKINALAQALGMPSKDLARAIAVAVREYVPPASLSSVAAQETGEAVRAMVGGVGYEHVKIEDSGSADTQSGGVVGGVMDKLDNFVGMDEP
ncbi:hypothetical protein H0H81_001725 [Sphagnurus paluster]|uniref:Uncharacterized protein n=1 Tax=Sphagnurus paluster TaxID=117069 RepID=A0A9P7FZS4_9AGAR|nr:hypothetical protein H0H81_001725 [Sphagnurus paluster]